MVTDSIFERNYGSAIYLQSSDLTLSGLVTFKENFARDMNGGAISIIEDSLVSEKWVLMQTSGSGVHVTENEIKTKTNAETARCFGFCGPKDNTVILTAQSKSAFTFHQYTRLWFVYGCDTANMIVTSVTKF